MTLDTQSSIKEAEVYRSMGLPMEAFRVYKRFLAQQSSLDAETKKDIKVRMEQLRREILAEEKGDAPGISEDDLSVVKQALSEGENTQVISDGAEAFREMGLVQEALDEYVKLIKRRKSFDGLVPGIADLLLQAGFSENMDGQVEDLLRETGLEKEAQSRFSQELAEFMLSRDHEEPARFLYQTAASLDPENREALEALSRLESQTETEETMPERSHRGEEKRREERISMRLPEFLSVEFTLGRGTSDEKRYRLGVLNYSGYGLGLLVNERNRELLKILKPGDRIEGMTFFARWALVKVNATVRHITPIADGEHMGQHIIGVESKELIDDGSGEE